MSDIQYKHISLAAEDTIRYLDGRRKGLIRSMKVGSRKLNKVTLDGFEWGSIITVCGLSGAGKSLMLEQWKREFVECNPKDNIKILSFEFEMLARNQLIRSLSSKVNTSTKDLQTLKVDDEEFRAWAKALRSMGKYPIYYVDLILNVQKIVDTILNFANKELTDNTDGIIVTLDHSLLVKDDGNKGEKSTIDALYKAAIEVKKMFEHKGINLIIVILSQLNREIEKQERVLNPELHHPTKNDLFGSSAAFYSSDYVIVTMRPDKIEGITEETGYGPMHLPLRNPERKGQSMIYWHVIKHRGGVPKILQMVENFKNSRIDEYHKT